MGTHRRTIGGVLAAAFVIVALNSAYTLGEREHAIITQFGAPVGPAVTSPGLHFKVPFIQRVHSFDRRYLAWDGVRSQIPTKDKRFLWLDSFARWEIADPLVFMQRLGSERAAMSRLDDILDGELRNVIARYDLIEIVRNSNRNPDEIVLTDEQAAALAEGEASPAALEEDSAALAVAEPASSFSNRLAAAAEDNDTAILEPITRGRRAIALEAKAAAEARAAELGIRILDFQIKRIGYVDEVQNAVFQRMISERNRAAEKFRSQGDGMRDQINGQRELEMQRISSTAFREAEEIRGRADAEAAAIYAEAYGRAPEFYTFVRSLHTLEQAVKADTRLVLTTDNEILKYLTSPR